MVYVLKADELVEVYTDVNDDRFGVGKVISCTDTCLIIHGILPNGEYDGVVLYQTDDIVKIISGSQYCKKIEGVLLKNKTKEIPRYKFKSAEDLLQASKNNHKIIDIQLLNSRQCDTSGIVISVRENVCLLRQITNFGEENGICQFRIDHISSMKYDSLENREIELLNISLYG